MNMINHRAHFEAQTPNCSGSIRWHETKAPDFRQICHLICPVAETLPGFSWQRIAANCCHIFATASRRPDPLGYKLC